jgi:Prenyltransferase and squalene oxidase repeat
MRWLVSLLAPVLLLASSPAAEIPSRDTPMDKAIDRALQFLANTQDKTDGSWKSYEPDQPARATRSPAITSLAVMAFLSAGHVPGEGRYGEVIEKGVRWVLKAQLPNGLIASEGRHEMYHHGIATLMLAEVAGMTEGNLAREIREKLEKAVAVILKAQRKNGQERGGWRYAVLGTDSDISVTGWQVMALRAAKNLGCDVPAENINQAVDYIKRCEFKGDDKGGFCYMVNAQRTVACTGTSILALEICGKGLHRSPESLKAGAFLLNNPPRWGEVHFFYTVYYCSQATFQLGHNYWNAYRPRLHEALLRNQKSNGSWVGDPRFDRESNFGPNYCTSMAVLALTVEYRFLPIYQRAEEPAERTDMP